MQHATPPIEIAPLAPPSPQLFD